MRFDLHVHSTASDGAYTPDEVVQLALKHQLDVIALTDHDSVAGIETAQQAAAGRGLQVLPGVELSAEDALADRHILGYLMDIRHPALNTLLADLQGARVRRVERILQKLAVLGIEIPLAEVLSLANGGSVGRPHVARALLSRGCVRSLQEAFDRYIGDHGPAYEPHYQLTPAQAIAAIHSAGGVAVLAHPGRYREAEAIIEALVPLGLDGVEVYYPDHTPSMVAKLRALARRHNLIMTAGSDFHRRDADGSARIGSVKCPANLDILGALHERARMYAST